MIRTALCGCLVLAALLAACTTADLDPAGSPTSDPDTGTVTQSLTNTCVIGCPSGYHPTKYFCSFCGGHTCTFSYDSTVCEPNAGFSFLKCDVGGCPANYHQTGTSCSSDCLGSSSAFCNGGPDQTSCQINAPIINPAGIGNGGWPANGQGQYEFHANTVLAIYGQNFVPVNQSRVIVSQNGRGWQMSAANSPYWWNGNYNQINTSLPFDIGVNQYATIAVSTDSGTSAGQSIYINP